MLKKSFLVAATVLAAACSEIPEKDLLKFPVKQIADLPQAVALSPEKAPVEPISPTVFLMNACGDKLYTNAAFLASYCVDAYDLDSGEYLAGLCRSGRGPGEFVDAFPYSVKDGSLIVAEIGDGTVSEVSLAEDAFGDVLHQVRLQGPEEGACPVVASAYKMAGEEVLVYNSIQAELGLVGLENPYYALYDWNSGKEKRPFRLFDAAPLAKAPETGKATAFALHDCMDDTGTTLCFVMGKMPVFALLDIASGEARGFRLKGGPAFSASMPQNCFHAVCAQGEYIYALYGPDMKNAKTTLYKLDWEGNLLNKYLLDGLYVTCCATPDKLYLSGTGDNNMQVVAIYQLDIKNL